MWIEVMNPNSIANANNHFAFMDSCYADSLLDAVVVGTVNGQTLYRLQTTSRTAGTACPSGTFFLMNSAEFATRQQEEKDAMQEREATRRAICQIVPCKD